MAVGVVEGIAELPPLHPVAGIRLGTTSAGIKTPGRQDLVVVELADKTTLAGVFTRNAFCAAPVTVAKVNLAQSSDTKRYLVINTGNANAGTGEQGIADAQATCESLAALVNTNPQQVLPFSTGVIGEYLPIQKLKNALPEALNHLSAKGWAEAAAGIMTTDTRPKGASLQMQCGNHTVTVTGVAKGAGMIRPNMATMLAYIATDAPVSDVLLQRLLDEVVSQSFNRITVDGDTSTNDACMLMASGQVPIDVIESEESPFYQELADAIAQICIELAQGLVRDGEGASKFVTVQVQGGRDVEECLQVAFTIAESPLVKTALFASDPNWGRLLAAIGRAGLADLDVAGVILHINGVLIASGGCRAESYTEEQGAAAMAKDDIDLVVNLNRGDEEATVWTTDLSYDYVRINAEYRT